jgi:hypothetical protein
VPVLAAVGRWLGGALRGPIDTRLGTFPIWGRRSHVPRDYDEFPEGCDGAELGDRHHFEDEANARADKMLRDELGPQYGLLVRQGYLDVPSTLFRNTNYRLRLRRPIEVFKNGRRQPWRLCIVSMERVPPADELLMKMLWLRANEEYVLTTANRVR